MTTKPPSLHQLRLHQLAVYMREAEQVLADWDLYSDLHSDSDGWPHNGDAYGLRRCQRDADTWNAFRTLLTGGHHLLDGAEEQLQQLGPHESTQRWRAQLARLREALNQLRVLRDGWKAEFHVPHDAAPGHPAHDDAVADRNAEAWHHLVEWADHGQALIDIDAAARQTARPSPSPAPARVVEPPQAPKQPRRGR